MTDHLMCGYCHRPATHHVIDTADDPICKLCATDQTDGPLREYVRPLTPAKVARYATTGTFN